ncbi:MAG: HAD family phosphatase [Pseudomonadota bacterium]
MAERRRAILWDMDGTLVDSEPLHEASLVSALRQLDLAPPPDFHEHIVGQDAQAVYSWCREHLGLSLPFQEWLRLKYRVYLAAAETLQSRSGAVDLFCQLREKGYPQAVVSNSDRMVVSANLDAARMWDPGLVTISRNDVRNGKPDGEPYLRAAWLLRREPADCLVVEDSITGARAGLAAAMRTAFWPQTEMAAPEGAEVVSSLAELESLILEEPRS